jgi:hypothetical protein
MHAKVLVLATSDSPEHGSVCLCTLAQNYGSGAPTAVGPEPRRGLSVPL